MTEHTQDLDAVAERAVNSVLQRLGVDTSNPLKAQYDFQKLRSMTQLMDDKEFQADLAFMRRWRTNTEKVTDTGIKTVAKWFFVSAIGLLVLATRDLWIKHVSG